MPLMSMLNSVPETAGGGGTRQPTPPSVLIRRLIGQAGVTQDTLAEAMVVSRLTVSQLVNDKRSVTAEMALRLGKVFGTSADFWLNLQRKVDLYDAQAKLGSEIARLKPLLQETPPTDVDELSEE